MMTLGKFVWYVNKETFAKRSLLPNFGHCEEQSDVVRQSTLADGLSTCCEIASLA